MSDKKTKMDCFLIARGTDEVDSSVAKDMSIPDPEPATGKKLIEKITEKVPEDDKQ